MAVEKTFWATTVLCFLGLLLNTKARYVGLPVDKIFTALQLVNKVLMSKKTTVRILQKLCGHLNFICKVIVPGRAFMRRLYAKFSSAMKPYYHVNVNSEMQFDLELWKTFLNEPTIFCRPFLDFSTLLLAKDLEIMTDASGIVGFGGIREGIN